MTQLQTHKTDFNQIRLVEDQVPALDAGDILVRIDRFSFTANNITYAVIGEKLRYWEFFPPAGEDAEGWGQIPVWGFATVTESQCDDIAVGERLFGYFPPANFVRMTPSRVMAGSFIDGVKHRQELPVGYNIYRRLSGENNYDPSFDTERMLLFPLFVTAFVLHDMLQSNQWYGAEQVIIGSASSKTSIGLAYAINESADKPKLVGLTSTGNLEQVEKLGLYDQVLCYEELSKIDAGLPAVIVDMSANGTILGQLHTHLGDNMKFCSNVGLTHWEASPPGAGFIAERSEMFFAPSYIQQRVSDWGQSEFDRRSNEFIIRTAIKTRDWLKIREIDSLKGLANAYADVCHGRIAADTGLIINLNLNN